MEYGFRRPLSRGEDQRKYLPGNTLSRSNLFYLGFLHRFSPGQTGLAEFLTKSPLYVTLYVTNKDKCIAEVDVMGLDDSNKPYDAIFEGAFAA